MNKTSNTTFTPNKAKTKTSQANVINFSQSKGPKLSNEQAHIYSQANLDTNQPILEENFKLEEEQFTFNCSANQSNLIAGSGDSDEGVSRDEDYKRIYELVIKYKRDWIKITKIYQKLYKSKVHKSALRKKFDEYDASNKRGEKYSSEEDKKLIDLIHEIGFDWIVISEKFPGRCPLSLRNRYYTMIKFHKLPREETSSPETSEEVNLKILVSEIRLQNPHPCFRYIEELMRSKGLGENLGL